MVIRSTLWLLLNFFVSKALIVLWQFYLARFFTDSPEQYGYYRLLLTQYSIWMLLAEGSLIYAVQQFIAGDRRNADEKVREFWPFIVGARTVTGLIAGIIFMSIIGVKYPALLVPSFILSITTVIFSLGTAPLGLWSGLGDFRAEAKSGLISTPVFISLAFIVTLLTNNITMLILCTLISNTVSGIYLWSKALRKWGLPRHIFRAFKTHGMKFLRFCIPLTISSFTFIFFYRADMMIITDEFGAVHAGIYSISLMLFSLFCELIWGQFGKAYTPSLIASWSDKSEHKNIERILKSVLEVCVIAGNLGLVAVALFGIKLFTMLFGTDSVWIDSVSPFFWLLTGFMPVVLFAITYRILLVEKGATGFMIVSILILVTKYTLVSVLAKSINIQEIALLSSFFMLLYYIILALMVGPFARGILLNTKTFLFTFIPVLILSYGAWSKNKGLNLTMDDNGMVFMIIVFSVMGATLLLNYSGLQLLYKHFSKLGIFKRSGKTG